MVLSPAHEMFWIAYTGPATQDAVWNRGHLDRQTPKRGAASIQESYCHPVPCMLADLPQKCLCSQSALLSWWLSCMGTLCKDLIPDGSTGVCNDILIILIRSDNVCVCLHSNYIIYIILYSFCSILFYVLLCYFPVLPCNQCILLMHMKFLVICHFRATIELWTAPQCKGFWKHTFSTPLVKQNVATLPSKSMDSQGLFDLSILSFPLPLRKRCHWPESNCFVSCFML